VLRSEKPIVVEEIARVYKESPSVIIAHYHGLTVAQVSALRESLKVKNAGFKVVKNTLAKIAASKSGLGNAIDLFSGPTAIAYSKDPVDVAKLVVEFSKTHEKLKIVGGIIDNQILNEHSIKELSKLPSLNELRGRIIGLLQSPATKIAGILQAPASSVVRVMQAYVNKD
jgi:large subunit ribosomal protein L10